MSPTGGVLVQRHRNGSSHNGRLCVPRLGSGSGLAHGAVLHGSHTRIHDLYVSRAQGHLQRGKKLTVCWVCWVMGDRFVYFVLSDFLRSGCLLLYP